MNEKCLICEGETSGDSRFCADCLRRHIGPIGEARWNDGVRYGIELYAWSKDGDQVVGMCGTRLAEALAEYED